MPTGFAIGRVPPERLLRHRTADHFCVDASPSPSDALRLVVLGKPRIPKRLEHAGPFPFEKAPMHRAGVSHSRHRSTRAVHGCYI
jgi:hypothetical protein